jgi:hypothetical protein
MFCPHCGKEIGADAKFCTVCGYALQAESGATRAPAPLPRRAPQRAGRRWPLLLPGVIVLIAIIGVGAVLLSGLSRVSGIGGDTRILYTLQDEGPFQPINGLMIMNQDGEDNLEIAYARDGLYVPGASYGEPPFLAPNGRWLAYYERTDDGFHHRTLSAR